MDDNSSYLDLPMREYIHQAAAGDPTPGGGSVAALAGALGTCMASMAANFTAGRKKFAAVEEEVRGMLDHLAHCREELLRCMDEDAVAFAAIGAAYSLSKETDEQKATRGAAIQAALAGAMQVPLAALRSAVRALEILPRLAEIGNPNLVSDTAVAAILCEACARGARLNVLINLMSLKDQSLIEQAEAELADLLPKAADLAKRTTTAAEKIIRRE